MILSKKFRISATLALIASISMPIATPAFAQGADADEAKRKVNLAGRQRMLSQRMSKAACFVATGVETEAQLAMLSSAYDLFSSTHVALRFGDTDMGLNKELKPNIQAALSLVDEKWLIFAPSIADIVSKGRSDSRNLQTLDESGLDLLGVMNSTVGKIAHAYGEDLEELPLILSLTIDLAGRQRMFTQKMSKEFCLLDAGINIDDNRASLKRTQELFNLTLTSLVDGFPGMVIPAPNEDINSKLAEVTTLWQHINTILERVASGGEITDQDRLTVAKDIEPVLTAMNEAVGMYEFVVLAD